MVPHLPALHREVGQHLVEGPPAAGRLHQAGLVTQRKDGRWIYYALPGRDALVAVREALDWVVKTLGRSPEALADRKRLAAIRRWDPSELSRKQLRA